MTQCVCVEGIIIKHRGNKIKLEVIPAILSAFTVHSNKKAITKYPI
jgi:hypothetical protein